MTEPSLLPPTQSTWLSLPQVHAGCSGWQKVAKVRTPVMISSGDDSGHIPTDTGTDRPILGGRGNWRVRGVCHVPHGCGCAEDPNVRSRSRRHRLVGGAAHG